MSMTHYMELLATNQPWNLIIYMAIPVILAETLVATEFFVVYTHQATGKLRTFNKWIGIILGFYFLGIFVNLITSAVPYIKWRGWVDVLAVGFYLSGVIPLFSIALMELGWLARGQSDSQKMKIHFILLTVFLVVAHIAMIFGMVDPSLILGAGKTHMPMH
ncbi:MAG: cytochrome oxidase biogenesis protein Surf12C [Pelotomaculum sp.]|nr:cytochrome oxidase biogenesis protein Surf12C [Pelotomaculum sp.]